MTERTAYRLSEVRAALGISRSTLYRWIEDGKIKVTYVCDRPRVLREDHPAPPTALAHIPALTSKRD
jgi:excisionase family DNA binding protein